IPSRGSERNEFRSTKSVPTETTFLRKPLELGYDRGIDYPWRITMSNANTSDRRDFLQQTAGAAAGLALCRGGGDTAQQNSQPALPTIRLGTHQVTRLIIGGNPIYGYSHFNRLLGQHQTAWHTPERVVELLRRCEQAGINTWQNSYAERTLQD